MSMYTQGFEYRTSMLTADVIALLGAWAWARGLTREDRLNHAIFGWRGRRPRSQQELRKEFLSARAELLKMTQSPVFNEIDDNVQLDARMAAGLTLTYKLPPEELKELCLDLLRNLGTEY